jgi:hypothetical protein
MEIPMKKILIALAVAGAFAAPAVAQMSSGTDKSTGATTGSSPLHSGGNAADRTPNSPKSDMPKSGAGATARGDFEAMDRNHDGYISRDEAKDASWNNRFSELDKDNDGRLSRSEFEAMSSSGASGATSAPQATPKADAPLTSGSNAADRTPSKPKQ